MNFELVSNIDLLVIVLYLLSVLQQYQNDLINAQLNETLAHLQMFVDFPCVHHEIESNLCKWSSPQCVTSFLQTIVLGCYLHC